MPPHRVINLWETFNDVDAVRRIAELRASARSTTNAAGCHVYLGSRNGDGYGQWTIYPTGAPPGRASQRAVLVHRLAYRAANPNAVFDEALHMSHICHNRACFNADHIVMETREKNISRIGCPGDVLCLCGCAEISFECPHGDADGNFKCFPLWWR